MARPRIARALGLGGLVASLALATPAHANGRPPRTVDLMFQPGAPDHLAVAATFGLLRSDDAGATWRWMCEQAIGYGGTYDPDYAFSGSGAIFATVFDGLVVMRDGCSFAPTALGSLLIATIGLGPDGTLLAGAGAADDSRLFRSTDDGVTFPTFVDIAQPGDWWQSIEFAPSDATRVYATGYRVSLGAGRELTLYRSDDGGVSFAPLSVNDFAVSELSVLEIAAVSPVDPDVAFARVKQWNSAIGDAIYRTVDAGASWTKVLELQDEAPGVLVRNATEVYVGTRNRSSGAWRSDDGGATFTPLPSSLDVHCLHAHPTDGSIWVCSHNYAPDELAVGSGPSWGAFTQRLRFEDVAGPVACDVGTVQRDTCGGQAWCGLKAQLGILSDEIQCTVTTVDAGGGGDDEPGPTCCGAGDGASGALVLGVAVVVPLARRRRRAARR
ncbi:MAG: hypothetical protein R2939_05455 [Kofleriaceae bacterium]